MRRALFVLVLGLVGASIGGRSESGLSSGARGYLAHCAVCHGIQGEGDGPLAPGIRAEGKASPARLDRERVTALGEAGVRAAIESGAHRRGATMPIWAWHLGPEWIERITQDVVTAPRDSARHAEVETYVAAPSGTPRQGRRVFVLYCSGCHGAEGRGDGSFSDTNTRRLVVRSIRRPEIARLDARALERLIGPGSSHAPAAETMPGWLHTISPDERTALLGYLRSLGSSP